MDHLQQFRARTTVSLPTFLSRGWRLKSYVILSEGREMEADVVAAASQEAVRRLPKAGSLADATNNHGVGFQIVHFAQVAVVSPVFYWQWGSVLANIPQMRALWRAPTSFDDGAQEVVGCVWEMDIVQFEVNAWTATILGNAGSPENRLSVYLDQHLA